MTVVEFLLEMHANQRLIWERIDIFTQVKKHHLQHPRKLLALPSFVQKVTTPDFKQNKMILPVFELYINQTVQHIFPCLFDQETTLLCSSSVFEYHNGHHWNFFQLQAIMKKAAIFFLQNIFWCLHLHSSVGYISKSRISWSSYISNFS